MAFIKRARARLKKNAFEKNRNNSELFKEYDELRNQLQETINGKVEKSAVDTAKMFDEFFYSITKEKKNKRR